MIISIILRNFKTYKTINYIPLSNGGRFSGLIGNNGIGKSSVLEALDSYFNSRNWSLHIDGSKSGGDESYIVPIFLIEKSKISNINKEIAEKYSCAIWKLLEEVHSNTTFHPVYKKNIEKLSDTINQLKGKFTSSSHFLLPLGENVDRNLTLNIFNIPNIVNAFIPCKDTEIDEEQYGKIKEILLPLHNEVKFLYDYIYIPKDIEPNNLVNFETRELQTLIGKNLEDEISKILTKGNISIISEKLRKFIDNISDNLNGYKFKVHSLSRQPNLKPAKIYSLIMEEFFSLRELHKEGHDGKDLPLRSLSSGEIQQAILNLFCNIIENYRKDSSNLILAVDEPEASLHISACFEQFEKLYKLSNICGQVLFTSHWYGFIPAMPNGNIVNINRKELTHEFNTFNISKYREEIKHQKIKHNDKIPIDILLKSNNDFIQSIISSVIKDEPYNWLICEGSSEKIYFEEYFKEEIEKNKLRIIPVGGAKEIKNIYNYLSISFEDLKSEIKGRVVLIMDTDAQLIEFETNANENLICKRLINDETKNQTELVKVSQNPKTPNTEIEDTLNGKLFHRTLIEFLPENPQLNFIKQSSEIEEIPSGFCLDLRLSENKILKDFFDNSNNKVKFASKYVELSRLNIYKTPAWIEEIKRYFLPKTNMSLNKIDSQKKSNQLELPNKPLKIIGVIPLISKPSSSFVEIVE